jgi:hypothetical protein
VLTAAFEGRPWMPSEHPTGSQPPHECDRVDERHRRWIGIDVHRSSPRQRRHRTIALVPGRRRTTGVTGTAAQEA